MTPGELVDSTLRDEASAHLGDDRLAGSEVTPLTDDVALLAVDGDETQWVLYGDGLLELAPATARVQWCTWHVHGRVAERMAVEL